MPQPSPIRISVISFLNAAPLAWSLHYEPLPHWVKAVYHTPAQCADALRTAQVDVAQLPSVEYQTIPNLVVLRGIAIASPVKARSVLLVSKKPLAELDEIGVTQDSRTSVALLRVIFRHFYARNPIFQTFTSPDDALNRFEGVLLIGDIALSHDFSGWNVYDLAELWRQHTGLPFVFAVWAIQQKAWSTELGTFLTESKNKGLQNIDLIARDYSTRLKLNESDLVSYLRHNLSYELGSSELSSLDLFYRLCREEGILKQIKPLELRP